MSASECECVRRELWTFFWSSNYDKHLFIYVATCKPSVWKFSFNKIQLIFNRLVKSISKYQNPTLYATPTKLTKIIHCATRPTSTLSRARLSFAAKLFPSSLAAEKSFCGEFRSSFLLSLSVCCVVFVLRRIVSTADRGLWWMFWFAASFLISMQWTFNINDIIIKFRQKL